MLWTDTRLKAVCPLERAERLEFWGPLAPLVSLWPELLRVYWPSAWCRTSQNQGLRPARRT
jgi:hypothetical protein